MGRLKRVLAHSFPILAALSWTGSLLAHQQPTTLVAMDIESERVAMHLHVPLNELELAFGHEVTQEPERRLGEWKEPFKRYLLEHIQPVTGDGRRWTVRVQDMAVGHAEQTQSGPFQEVLVDLSLVPPAGGDTRDFVLRYDVILHQVVTHKALVSVRNDWAGGSFEPVKVGTILVDTGTGQIAPLAVHFGEGSWWAGFQAMVKLGAQHIREGTDHLLFLIVLLLPATLTVRGKRWGGFGGNAYSMRRLVTIVTAFTLGHSATLLAGALHWFQLPQQPVEVLIAFSILVTAIHAMRPVFAGNEALVAAGFGLVHGLAFATVLAELQLAAGPLALSIFGFNLGIELMQLFVIALTMPWLIVLSKTAAHSWVRISGAVLAGIAAIGWIANRVSGESNAIEQAMEVVTRFSPVGILMLAAVAIPAYLSTKPWQMASRLEERISSN